jgi:hypothetical protein
MNNDKETVADKLEKFKDVKDKAEYLKYIQDLIDSDKAAEPKDKKNAHYITFLTELHAELDAIKDAKDLKAFKDNLDVPQSGAPQKFGDKFAEIEKVPGERKVKSGRLTKHLQRLVHNQSVAERIRVKDEKKANILKKKALVFDEAIENINKCRQTMALSNSGKIKYQSVNRFLKRIAENEEAKKADYAKVMNYVFETIAAVTSSNQVEVKAVNNKVAAFFKALETAIQAYKDTPDDEKKLEALVTDVTEKGVAVKEAVRAAVEAEEEQKRLESEAKKASSGKSSLSSLGSSSIDKSSSSGGKPSSTANLFGTK